MDCPHTRPCIRYNPLAKAALKAARVIVVTLIAKDTTGPEWSEMFVNALAEIESVAAKATPPALFKFGRNPKLIKMPI